MDGQIKLPVEIIFISIFIYIKWQMSVICQDYHVILIHQNVEGGESVVFDLDSRLGFPCDFGHYVTEGIRSDDPILPQYRRLVGKTLVHLVLLYINPCVFFSFASVKIFQPRNSSVYLISVITSELKRVKCICCQPSSVASCIMVRPCLSP